MAKTKSEKEIRLDIVKQIKTLGIKKQCETVGEAIVWSNQHPETQPHFISHKDGGHVIIN